MRLPKITVSRPVTTAMVYIAILLIGLFAWRSLPRDLLPDIEIPTLTVVTIYPGASAEDVEKQVTNRLETSLSGTENLKLISSMSRENVSFISLQFEWGTDVTEAANSARDLMELVKKDLPANAYSPYIMKINSSMIPIVVYTIQADESYSGLERIAYDKIIAPLKKVKGVGSAFIIAQASREIEVRVNPVKLKAYNLNINQLATILKAENISVPGGNIKFDIYDFAVRTPGEVGSVEEIKNIAITSMFGKVIRLKDVAEIVDHFKEKDEIAYSGGNKAVGLFIQKQSGTNTYEVFQDVLAEMENIERSLPPDIKTEIVFDTATIVKEVTKNLSDTIWYAGLFVIIVVFVFLRKWRNSLIVILTIPFSMILAFITMQLLNYTINIFSLMSLIVAIGMVVDNAIVVIENINRHIEEGAKPKQAAIFGTSEMGNAIIASTLTTISVFIPLIFVGGIVGILFKQLAILVSVTLLGSLITALSLTPMISSLLLKPHQKEKKNNALFRVSEQFFIWFENFYKSTLKIALKIKFPIILGAILLFGSTIYIATKMGSDYIPDLDAGDLIATIETEVGTSVYETERIAKIVETIFEEEVPEMESQYTIIGQTETNLLTSIGFSEGKNKATISAKLCLPQDRERSAEEIAEIIRKRLAEIPEIENYKVIGGSMLQNMLFGNYKPIEIKITGQDFDKLNETANYFLNELKTSPHFQDIESTVDRGKMEFQIIIDKDLASSKGLNTAMIAMQVRQSIYGAEAGYYTEEGQQYKITIRYKPDSRNSIEEIKKISLTTLLGTQVNLSSIASIEEAYAPLEINHETQSRIVRVGANLKDITLSEGADIAREMIANADIDPAIRVELGGRITDQEESFGDLNIVFIISILLVYMIMASQFESLKDPFIIIFAVPFSLIGVILAFLVTGTNLNIVSFLGIIMLLGIVVNNGIVLVDYTNLLRGRSYKTIDAILEAGKSRLRPVLMTSFTTMLAMIPMILSKSIGYQIWIPLGITIVGGLLVSMLITLILIPCIYAVMNYRAIRNEKTIQL
jgi:hydrophobe/amphiphile efflux-1 (HAE1) family protein